MTLNEPGSEDEASAAGSSPDRSTIAPSGAGRALSKREDRELPNEPGEGHKASKPGVAGGLPQVSTIAGSEVARDGNGRYQRREFHARGGLGEVWRSDDSVLGREVAVKVLRHDDDEAIRVRFEAEAQITGQLEHPNIVPVHDLGSDKDGRPFYVMKFVRGRTLKSEIQEYYSGTSMSGADRPVKWARLLQVFVELCHAVAYAHSRGVIHRDLKPDNVMLGAYGETLLLDWGLAKPLKGSTVRGETGGDSGLSGGKVRSFDSGSATGDGTVLGTPSYMAPEMAAGQIGKTDQRTDIYLLGATLYEIITGQMPRRGTSRDEIVEMARTVPPPPARQVQKSCPRPLEAIAAKAMAQLPEDRYESAMALAEDVQRYLADEPVGACPESIVRRVWRWCKRHRKAIGRSAVGVALIALLISAFASAQALARSRRREQARAELLEFRRHAGQSRYFAANADLPTERAPYYDPRRAQEEIEAALHIADGWGAKLQRFGLLDQLPQLRGEMYGTLLLGAQLKSESSVDLAQARQLLDRAAGVQGVLTRGFHRISSAIYRRSGDLPHAEAERQLADSPEAAPDAEDLFLQAESMRQQTAAASEPASRFELLHSAVAKYKQALRVDPAHYWAHFQLGRCQLALGNPDDAATELGTCIALHPEQPWGYSARGLAFALARNYREAIGDLETALRLDPDFQPARMNLGVCRWLRKDYAGARESLTAAMHPARGQGLPEAAYYLGRVSLERRQFNQAIEDCSQALKERPLPAAYACRAIAFLLSGDEQRALSDLDSYAVATGISAATEQQKHAMRGDLLVHWPEDWPSQPTDRAALLKLAMKELAQSDERSSTVWADRGLALDENSQAIACFARSLQLDRQNSKTWRYLGEAHDRMNDHRSAARDFAQVIALDPADAMAHAWLGYEHALLANREAALREAAQAMELAENDYRAIVTVACIHSRLSQLDSPDSIHSKQQLDSTVAALRHAFKVWHTTLAGPDLVRLIVEEDSFRLPQLVSREDFKALDPAIREGAAKMRQSN